LKDEEELQSWFIRRMEQYLVSRGKKLIGWDEILEGGLAPEATVMSWRGMKGGLEAARQNHNVVMTPEGSCYLNLYQGDPELEPVAWGGFLPLNKVYAFDPVPEELTPDEAKHIIGAQGCLWTEYIETPGMIEYMILPRLSAIAEVVWTDKALRDWDGFRERMVAQYARYDAMGVNYAKSAYNVSYDIDVDQTTFNATVVMRSDAAGTDIRYTLDGSDPTPSSALYTGPVVLTTTAHVAAASFADGSRAGETTSIVYNRHKAAGVKPVLGHTWYSGYPGQGEYTLTNCLMGSNNYADGQWQGFLGNDLAAVIDLGSEKPIRRITTTFFHNPGVWIFMPVEIEYSVSADGVAYERVAHIDSSGEVRRTGPVIVDFPEDLNNVSGRFVKVRAKNIGVCPEWHAGAGGAAFLFADEIVVE
jgi:hexosaminidase